METRLKLGTILRIMDKEMVVEEVLVASIGGKIEMLRTHSLAYYNRNVNQCFNIYER